MATRDYSTRRMAIIKALEDKLKGINGNFPYRTNLYSNVLPRLKFWDEVEDFPAVHLSAGSETRNIKAADIKIDI